MEQGVRIALAAAAAVSLGSATPASAQNYNSFINDAIMLTIMNMGQGSPCGIMPDNELAEARDPAPALMQAYFAAAQSGGAKSASFKLNKKTSWSLGTTVADMTDLDEQADPFAAAGNVLDPDPLRFYRGGTYTTAQGQWAVRGPGGEIVGVYDALLEREKKIWKIHELTLIRADEQLTPANQYCAEPGDLTRDRVNSTGIWVDSADTQLRKRRVKLATAEEKLHQAEAKAAEKPDSASRATAVREARAAVDREAERVADAEAKLAEAREGQAKARADLAAYEALIGPARDAHRIREVKDEAVEPGG